MSRTRTILWILFLCINLAAFSQAIETEEFYYAIKQDATVCGYAHVIIEPTQYQGRQCLHLRDSLWVQMKAMGKDIEGHYLFEYIIDPEDGMYLFHSSKIEQGSLNFGATMEVRGDSVIIVSTPDMDTSVVTLPPETLFKNTRLYRHFLDFFIRDGLTEKECRVFSEIDSKANSIVYSSRGRQQIELAGRSYDALIVDGLDRTTGIQTTMWVDAESGLLLKERYPQRMVELADAAVRDNMGRADIDKNLYTPVDTIIANPWALSYVKVRAGLQPGGLWITPEGLNVPGQRFEGTVENNRIDGIFEISRDRYDGSQAPPFPCDFSGVDSLAPYLEPANMIESDDPAIVAKAIELTTGAADAWDAATRLSRWVQKEITYDLPGGGTAAKTYELRLGECGSHANLLTAFCRAVGIPARGVFGCLYIPEHGGAFGQHAWNEIYMGEAGWIPVECTADEVTYADCGHIRIGEWISMAVMLNAEKMELLEYHVGEGTYADLVSTSTPTYDGFIGRYQGPDRVMTVQVQENRLALDIPGRMVFQLKDPDENGEWFFVLTDRASVEFDCDASGKATAMIINSRQRMPREADSAAGAGAGSMPERFRSLVGRYTIPMQNAGFSIGVSDDQLVLITPGSESIPLRPGDETGDWIGDTGKSMLVIAFEMAAQGEVSAMRFNEVVTCPRVN